MDLRNNHPTTGGRRPSVETTEESEDGTGVEYLVSFNDEDQDSESGDGNLLTTHTLVLRSDGNSKTEYFFCLQCMKKYTTIHDFAMDHEPDDDTDSPNKELDSHQNNNDDIDEEDHANLEDPIKSEVVEDEIVECEADIHLFDETADENQFIEMDDEAVEEKNIITIGNEEIQVQDDFIKKEQDTESEMAASNDNNEKEIDRYYCYECGAVFTDLKVAEAHQCPSLQGKDDGRTPTDELYEMIGPDQNEDSAGRKQFTCSHCPKSYASQQALTRHKKIVHNTKTSLPSFCSICNIEFSSSKSLKLHEKMHAEKVNLRSIKEALPEGAELEMKKRKCFYCQICKKNFDHSLLKVHRNMHLNKEEHICGICNKKFDSQASYELHQQLHANMAAKKAQLNAQASNDSKDSPDANAPTTGGAVKLKSRSKHVANAKRLYPCQYCGHEFSRPHEKVIHERVHTGEKPHVCEVCGKRFRTSYSLTLHLRTHTDIRPYVCATCNKRFKSHSVYVHHLRIHQSEKAYKCDVCDKAFRTSVQLSGHKKSHTKPFTCTICNRPFANLYSVTNHMKSHSRSMSGNDNHSDALKHRCHYCGAVYARSFSLRCHLSEKHGFPSNGENNTDSAMAQPMTTSTALQEDNEEVIVSEENYIIEQNVTGNNSDNDAIYVDDDDAAMQLITAAAEAAAASSSSSSSSTATDKLQTKAFSKQKDLMNCRSPSNRNTFLQAQNEEMLAEIITGWLDK